ncbi:UPF0481 protein At3g47200-like [Actinidia eriantha]|uniref:UPF0481 protein At3g47200-like n=1 Tax=Actinidia eriantha TaxID=165200 RepID=UPI002590763E|nr:UPF0481 protein At3g47200-like [Actinidia eriantha]
MNGKTSDGASSEGSHVKTCTDCGTTKNPLWRGGPAGPKRCRFPCTLPLSLQRMLSERPSTPQSPSRTFIYRVPMELRIGSGHHYTPTTVSIGPLHVANPNLDIANGQQLKAQAFDYLLDSFRGETILQSLEHFLKEKEVEVRDCYAETFKLNSDEFVQMMLLDCCLILALLTGFCPIRFGRERELFLRCILQDLLLLENQLPFFVLEGLSQLEGVFLSDLANRNFRLYILEFFLPILPNRSFLQRDLVFPVTTPKHLLELVLLSVFPTRPSNAPLLPFRRHYFGKINLSELALYGITFSLKFSDSITDIRFSANGVLEIPPLRINESSTSLFKNLLAFEMCSGAQTKSCLVSYLFLMDSLVDTDKDVEQLVSAGVLETTLNDKQALVTLLSDLATNMVVDDDMEYFKDVYKDLQEYCDSSLAQWRANFRQYYYESRWDILNSILLFILTVTQTLFAILVYISPETKTH